MEVNKYYNLNLSLVHFANNKIRRRNLLLDQKQTLEVGTTQRAQERTVLGVTVEEETLEMGEFEDTAGWGKNREETRVEYIGQNPENIRNSQT